MKLKPDLLEAKHWIYPINRPKRDYQYNIVKNCLFNNTLVALPTGLGKTLIAGVVMFNCMLLDAQPTLPLTFMDLDYRWYREGKVVFVAPTKPLVAQQVNACLETCGIPGRDSVELTGEVPKAQRVKHVRINYT
jgi:ATP-dependent DNA helicase MPH1